MDRSADWGAVAARVSELPGVRRVLAGGDDGLNEALTRRGVSLVDASADLAVVTPHSDWPDVPRLLCAMPRPGEAVALLARAAARGLAADFGYQDGMHVLLVAGGSAAGALADGGAGDGGPADAAAALLEARAALLVAQLQLAQERRVLDQRLARHDAAQGRAIRLNTGLADKLMITEARLAIALHERELIVNSSMWRALGPVRRGLDRLRRRRRPGTELPVDAGAGPGAYGRWVKSHDTLDDADRAAIGAHIDQFEAPPTISVVMPAYDTDPALLRAAIASVRAQLYPHWQLCVADDASPSAAVGEVLAEAAAADRRIVFVRLAQNGNICVATNAALALAVGDFVALMDHDDLLPEHALYEVAAAIDAHPQADLVYSDEDQIDADGRRTMPYFKPDFSMDLMLAHNMVSHLGVYRRSLLERLGGARPGYEGSQDYDIALRVADATTPDRIRHIPAVLYHWRQHAQSFSKARLDACVTSARRAIGDHLARVGQAEAALVRPAPSIPSWTRIQYRLAEPAPLASVIVPTRDKPELLARCARGVLAGTDYPALELLIVDNGSTEPATISLLEELRRDPRVRVLAAPGPFNYAAMNNDAVAQARGDVLVLLNNDIEIRDGGWLTEMASQALRPGIGAVGARLIYPSGRVQHAGVVLGVGSFDGGPGVAGHFSLDDDGTSFGYFGASVLVHEVAAVTAACMVLRRAAWDAAGGFDAAHLPVAFNDVDLCLKLRAAGLRNIYTPFAELMHHESASRGDDLAPEHRARFERECRFMRDRWGPVLDADPFYNPNFSRLDGMFRLLGPSVRTRPWR